MAQPRVFISSTCYDLSEVRDSLCEFIENLFYHPALSERGDIFYHPDFHTHASCINEVGNCHFLILIIGGRFGGEYIVDFTKSITNAEYEAAKKLNIPVFTFIKKNVFAEHKVYQKNKKNKEKVFYPSIENQEYASRIFEFINDVRLSEVNNGLFEFEYAKDIKLMLGKQLAGMMHDFLQKRNLDTEQRKTNAVLDNLTLLQKKTEEILENIYKEVDKKGAPKKIEQMENELLGKKFFYRIFKIFVMRPTFKEPIKTIAKIEPTKYSWTEFLAETNTFKLWRNRPHVDDPQKKYDWLSIKSREGEWLAGGDFWTQTNQKIRDSLEKYYEGYKKLDEKTRLKVLTDVIEKISSPDIEEEV